MQRIKKALITGINGQDGSYLAELLLDKGYEVHGSVRREALEDPEDRLWRLTQIMDRIHLHPVEIDNYANVFALIEALKPEECYHLAARSFVSYGFDDEFSIINLNTSSTHYLLAALHQRAPECRFYFSGSSEMFGQAPCTPQNELTPFNPRSLYGVSKLASYHLTRNYRDSCGMFSVTGILYNHESPRRGMEYVTRKVTAHAAAIKLGRKNTIRMGNLYAQRDWGHARDYVEAMWRMLQADEPRNYVICTGSSRTVQQLLEVAFDCVDLNYHDYVELDDRCYRRGEVVPLVGDARRVARELGWCPHTTFEELIEEMVHSDLNRLRAA